MGKLQLRCNEKEKKETLVGPDKNKIGVKLWNSSVNWEYICHLTPYAPNLKLQPMSFTAL